MVALFMTRHDVIWICPNYIFLKWFAIYGRFYRDVKIWSWTLSFSNFRKNLEKNFNDSSSNFKMTFWIKIRNSASSYNRFVSSWKGMKSHFSHHHHLQALNATRVGQKFKNLIKIFKEYSYFERNEPFLDPSYFVVCRRVRFSLMFLKAVLITW